jgi:hypothetical protein
VNVLDDQQIVHRGRELPKGGDDRVGEDVFVVPGIDLATWFLPADGVDEEGAIGRQTAGRLLHVGAVVPGTDVLHQTDRDDGIVATGRFAVVLQAEFDRQLGVALLRPPALLARYRVADDRRQARAGAACPSATDSQNIEDCHGPKSSPTRAESQGARRLDSMKYPPPATEDAP